MDMLSAMRIFVRVVERGSLSAAARDLGLGQPTVSERVDKLEKHLSARLLYRTTRSVQATDSGTRFYEYAKRAMSSGKLIFGIFAALAEFEGDLIREKTMAGLAAARARGRRGGRQFELTKNQIRLAQAAMANRDTNVADLCGELGISRATLYRYVGPEGQLRDHAKRVFDPI